MVQEQHLKCGNCKEDFTTKSKTAIFCSGKCRLQHFRRKRKLWKLQKEQSAKHAEANFDDELGEYQKFQEALNGKYC